MNKKYISDIIPLKEIAKWLPGERILIRSQTGSGKSQFIKHALYQHCQSTGQKILLLSNRSLLKDQNRKDIEEKGATITARNYQELEFRVNLGEELPSLFEPYSFIVYDEAHYFFSDSQFNRNTDLLIEPILHTPPDKVFIFLTATPSSLIHFQPQFQHRYTAPKSYGYIRDIYFYSKKETLDRIFSSIPFNEKAVFFSSDAVEAFETAQSVPNASFICSKDNRSFGKKSSEKTMGEIVGEEKFSCQILCTTKVLDNGVNLHDTSLKHMIIDMLDPTSFIQCLGRKRVREGEQITLYVKNYPRGYLGKQLQKLRGILKLVEELQEIGETAFRAKYQKMEYDSIIQNDFSINQAKQVYYQQLIHYLVEMVRDPDKMGYQKTICKALGYPFLKIKNAELIFEQETLTNILENLQGIKLFDEDKESFKRIFFENLFHPKKTNFRRRGLRSINAILEEDNLPFRVSSMQEMKTQEGKRKKYCWIIYKVLQSG